jgi:hypothetical protein
LISRNREILYPDRLRFSSKRIHKLKQILMIFFSMCEFSRSLWRNHWLLIILFIPQLSIFLLTLEKGKEKSKSVYKFLLFLWLPYKYWLTTNYLLSSGTNGPFTRIMTVLAPISVHPWFKDISMAQLKALYKFFPSHNWSFSLRVIKLTTIAKVTL